MKREMYEEVGICSIMIIGISQKLLPYDLPKEIKMAFGMYYKGQL